MILAIVGPTGVGKTKLSIELAKRYQAIIVNADAMQVYQGMNIGTAKITDAEKEGIPHFLFDFVPVTANYTVFDYQRDLRSILKKYEDRNIILVGGTGLYLKAGLYDYRFVVEEKKINTYDGVTNEELYQLALKKDAQMNIHVNNRKRLIRFLNREVKEIVEPTLLYPTIFIGLTTDRDRLYQIINERVIKMMEQGLLLEVKGFYDQNIRAKSLMTAIGYKELYDYFDGNCSLEEAITAIQTNSRHYAKRQYTWFRNQLPVNWFSVNYEHFEQTIREVIQFLETK